MKATHVLAAVGASMLFACGSAPEAANETTGASGSASGASPTDDARIAGYLESLYFAADVRHTFVSRMGDTIDCVTVESEPGVRALLAQGRTLEEILEPFAEPAPMMQSGEASARPGDAYFTGDPDESGSVRTCPAMTVPHVRITPERIARAGGLDRYLASKGHGAPAPSRQGEIEPDTNPTGGGLYPTTNQFYDAHVFSSQTSPSGSSIQGGTAIMTIAVDDGSGSMFGYGGGDFALQQIWIYGGSGAALQTLEVGSKTSVDDNGPYLFVGATANDYGQFCENGNQTTAAGACVPWVGNPSSTLALQQYLPGSTPGGTQHELLVDVQARCPIRIFGFPQCYWDVYAAVDGAPETLLGYFPFSGYDGGALAGQATGFETGGEVYDTSADFSYVQMGEGDLFLGLASYGSTAYVRNFGYYSTTCLFASFNCVPTLVQNPATVYTTNDTFTYNTAAAAGSSSWTNWFYYGNYEGLHLIPIQR